MISITLDTTAVSSAPAACAHREPGCSTEKILHSREIVAQLKRSEIYSAYEEAFQVATGLPLALRPVGTLQSPLRDAKRENGFCALVARANSSCAACLRLQEKVEIASSEGPGTLTCHAGLVESAVPIRVGENIVAYLQTGQVMLRRPTKGQLARTIRNLRESGIDTPASELEAAYFQTRVLSRVEFSSILRLLSIFAEHLSVIVNQLVTARAKAELPAVAKARSYIQQHQTEVLTLTDVARAVNMSAFYFCKIFRKVTGVTFVEYLARLRVDGVKNLLLDPHKRISEAAFEAGFQSLSQFNRVFRRLAGEAPTRYREKLHGSSEPSAPIVFAA